MTKQKDTLETPSYEWVEKSRMEFNGYIALVKYTHGYYKKTAVFYRAFMIDRDNTIHKGKISSNLMDAMTSAGLMIADELRK